MSIYGLLNQTLIIYGKSSYDEYGRPQVGSGTSIKARVQAKTTRKILANGDIVTIDAIAYVPQDTSVNTDDKVSFDSNTYKVFGKYPVADRVGDTHHIKLELMKWQM